MKIQKSTGIILSSRRFGEADILSNILTKEFGKKKFIFKGLKKSKKRSLTATEPGTIIDLIYYYHENKDSYIVNRFNINKHYLDIRKDLDKIYHMYFILEIVDKTTGFHDINQSIFDLLAAGIDTITKTDFIVNLSVFFTIHLLRFHGILPNLKKCKTCGSTDFRRFSIDIDDLNPICDKCTHNKNRLLNFITKEFISASLKQKFVSIEHINFEKKDLLDLLFYLSLFIEHYYNIELKSKKFILSG